MKKRLQRFVSVLLVLTFCFTLGISTTAYATDVRVRAAPQYTFLDSEGKENTLETSLLSDGRVVTTLYIEGELIATTTTQYNEETGQIHINRVANEGDSINQTVPISQFIIAESASPIPLPSSSNSSFDYEGRINYKPYMGENLKVSVYTSLESAWDHYEEFGAEAGTAIDVLVSTLGSYLASLYPKLLVFSHPLLQALMLAAEVTVVAGIIKSSFVQEYYVTDYLYSVKTVASDSGAEQIYNSNHAYKFMIDGEVGQENWTEIIRFDYLQWDDDGVATQFFSDFWGVGNCPGIQSYTYA